MAIDATKPIWVIRAGKRGERDSWCLDNNVMGGGWRDVPDLTECQTREDVEAVVRAFYGTEKPGVVANYTGQLWALRGRITVGDTLVLPLKTTSQLAIGVCTSGYSYDPDAPADQRIQLGVQWVRTDVPRTAARQDLLYTLGSALTVFQAVRHDAACRIASLANNGIDPGPGLAPAANGAIAVTSITDEPEASPDIVEVARDRVVNHIASVFAGHRMADLVAAVLQTQGYVCEISPPGSDGGIDVIAGRGALGLDSPRLVVQVKSGEGAVGDTVVRDVQGLITGQQADQGLLVAWGGLTAAARSRVAYDRFLLRVWDADALVDAVLNAYDQLPEYIRTDLPLRRIWVLNTGEEQV